ncbi:hypothetical protein ACWFMI_11740 [Nocardiopsis terrae]
MFQRIRDYGSDCPLRELSPREKGVLEEILSRDIPGFEELRQQVQNARVSGNWGSDLPSIDIEVPETTPRSSVRNIIAPVDVSVLGERGEYLGEILVWLDDGRISAVEYAWVSDSPPRELPEVRQLKISPDRRNREIFPGE